MKSLRDEHEKAMKESYQQVVTLTSAQTAAIVKLESTLASLREVIYRLSIRER